MIIMAMSPNAINNKRVWQVGMNGTRGKDYLVVHHSAPVVERTRVAEN